MEIMGYKAFNKNRTNRYGKSFEEGKSYHIEGPISFGDKGHGFHMCVHLSDVFRYFDPNDIDVALVIGSGEYASGEDETWSEPYYEMYSVSDIKIVKFLSREEIIDIMSHSSSSDIVKFFATFKPTEEEALQILKGNKSQYDHEKAVEAYLYYFKGINVYKLDYIERTRVLQKTMISKQDGIKY